MTVGVSIVTPAQVQAVDSASADSYCFTLRKEFADAGGNECFVSADVIDIIVGRVYRYSFMSPVEQPLAG